MTPSPSADLIEPSPPRTPAAAAGDRPGSARGLTDGPLSPAPASSLASFLQALLDEQRQLQTPVAQFAARHEAHPAPVMEKHYRDLIPLSAPRAGEQYAFEVDLDSCSGCKACVAGCHSLNGLDEKETWRDVGLLLGGDEVRPFQQTVTTACHHCADPGCLRGCPVLAYEKDSLTGIVRHLDDQCIGCQYCVLTCPYDVPKYSERLGIVRKCDLCHGRLSAGEAPACVQACPTEAIRVVTVPITRTGTRETADTTHFLPTAPDPEITQPTTRYVSARPLPHNVRAADADAPTAAPAHMPLVVMLVLTQAGLGLLTASVVDLYLRPGMDPRPVLFTGLALLATGLVASVAHLGQPLRAWRVFLNLRQSWLSREAVIFGAVLPLAAVYGLLRLGAWDLRVLTLASGASLAVGGLAAIVCSIMIYVAARRDSWSGWQTGWRFGGTWLAALLFPFDAWATMIVIAIKVLGEVAAHRQPHARGQSNFSHRPEHASVRLTRHGRLIAGGAALVLGVSGLAWWSFGAFLLGELLERRHFFQSVTPSKMPGVPRA